MTKPPKFDMIVDKKMADSPNKKTLPVNATGKAHFFH